jgi:prevent-host-death family protein
MAEDILSLSQFKADASRLLDQVRDEAGTLVLTQNGRARAVVQDYAQYQARERALVMLKLMAEGERDIASGDTLPQAEVFAGLRQQLRARGGETGGGQDG